MIRIICDRCGSVVSDAKMVGYISLLHRQGPGGTLEGNNEFEECHFCEACMGQVGEFIRHSLGDTVGNIPDRPAEELARGTRGGRKGHRKSIDYGKIMALKDAKWSNRAIAEEMGMTPESVATAVCNYRKGKAGTG